MIVRDGLSRKHLSSSSLEKREKGFVIKQTIVGPGDRRREKGTR